MTWPLEISENYETINSFLATYEKYTPPRYGSSFAFKVYKPTVSGSDVSFSNIDGDSLTIEHLVEDNKRLLEMFGKAVSVEIKHESSPINQGLFYMEKQLEDFIIHNWDKTDFGKKYDLMYEDGELISQQFRTSIGPIDILAKDKTTGSYIVIELKKNQTSDDTVGQLARYMGWIKKEKSDANVRGVIIAGKYDRKLEYAIEMVPNTEVYLYRVDFVLEAFNKD